MVAAIGRFGKELILQNESVLPVIGLGNVQLNAIVGGEIPLAIFARSSLRCEACATEGFDIQGSAEGSLLRAAFQVGLLAG